MNFRQYTNATDVVVPNKVKVANSINLCKGMSNLVSANIISDSVTDMTNSFHNCYNLTTPSACGSNVTNMSNTYRNCTNLTTAVCGPNVTNMCNAYRGCTNLTMAIGGPNVTDMRNAYSGCTNIQGNAYFYMDKYSYANTANCFKGKGGSRMLNIYISKKSPMAVSMVTNQSSMSSITGTTITWTHVNTATNNCYYNTAYNLYVYPVSNVEQARIDNGD